MEKLTTGQNAYLASFHTGHARKIGTIIAFRDGVSVATQNGTIFDGASNIQVQTEDGLRWFPRWDIYNDSMVAWIGFTVDGDSK